MKTQRLSWARLTERFGESSRPPRLQKSFNNSSGFMAAVNKAYLAQRYCLMPSMY